MKSFNCNCFGTSFVNWQVSNYIFSYFVSIWIGMHVQTIFLATISMRNDDDNDKWIRVDGKVADSKISGYVWTGPKGESSYFSTAFLQNFANTKRAMSNFSFAFIVFLLASMVDDSLTCKSLFCNCSRTRRIPPVPFLASNTSHIWDPRMRTAYYCMHHYF